MSTKSSNIVRKNLFAVSYYTGNQIGLLKHITYQNKCHAYVHNCDFSMCNIHKMNSSSAICRLNNEYHNIHEIRDNFPAWKKNKTRHTIM